MSPNAQCFRPAWIPVWCPMLAPGPWQQLRPFFKVYNLFAYRSYWSVLAIWMPRFCPRTNQSTMEGQILPSFNTSLGSKSVQKGALCVTLVQGWKQSTRNFVFSSWTAIWEPIVLCYYFHTTIFIYIKELILCSLSIRVQVPDTVKRYWQSMKWCCLKISAQKGDNNDILQRSSR